MEELAFVAAGLVGLWGIAALIIAATIVGGEDSGVAEATPWLRCSSPSRR